jgi:hypothetical protein
MKCKPAVSIKFRRPRPTLGEKAAASRAILDRRARIPANVDATTATDRDIRAFGETHPLTLSHPQPKP